MRNALCCLSAAWILIAFSGLAFGASAEEGKIPITTSSDEALQHYLAARELQDNLQIQESLGLLQRAVTEDPNFALAHMALALAEPTVQGFFERFAKATALVDKVSDGERLWILGFQAGVNADPMRQRDYYQQLVAAFPRDERAYNLLGNHYFGLQEYVAASTLFEKAIAINPEYPQPYNQLGYAHRFLGNYKEAENAFKRYIELIPDDPNPYDSYAELLLKMGRFEEAIESYRKALETNALFVASHTGIATCLNLLDHHEDARQQLKLLRSSARNEADTRAATFAEIVSYVDEGSFDKALDTVKKRYEDARKSKDTPAMAADLVLLGNILLELNNPDEALAKFQESVQIMQESGLSDETIANAELGHFYNAARVAVQQGEIETAKRNAADYRSRAETRGNPFQLRLAHEIAGIIALEEEEFDTAISELQQANQQNPYNLYRISLAYRGKHDPENSKLWCENAANFNGINNLNYAFIRRHALDMLKSM